jgi:hypothetical protein
VPGAKDARDSLGDGIKIEHEMVMCQMESGEIEGFEEVNTGFPPARE